MRDALGGMFPCDDEEDYDYVEAKISNDLGNPPDKGRPA